MVKKLMKFFAYLLFFILSLILFIPKDSVYFFVEKNLKQFDVIVSKEHLTQNFFSLDVENMEVSVKAIDAALIQKMDITLLGVYNHLSVENIKLSSLVESYLPSKVDSLEVGYSLLSPLHVLGDAKGEFGKVSLLVNLVDRNISVALKPSKLMFSKYRNSLRMFKKSKNGEYIYAKSF
jgi:hypothetical protein